MVYGPPFTSIYKVDGNQVMVARGRMTSSEDEKTDAPRTVETQTGKEWPYSLHDEQVQRDKSIRKSSAKKVRAIQRQRETDSENEARDRSIK